MIPAAIGVLVVNLNTFAHKLGEQAWLTIATSGSSQLWASSIGGHAAMRQIVRWPEAIQITPPLLGVATTIILMAFAFNDEKRESPRRYLMGMAVVVGCLPIFSRRFLEVTPYGFPIAVSALCVAGAFSDRIVRKGRMYIAGFLGICAGFFHGAYLLVPLVLLVAAISHPKAIRWYLVLRTSLAMGIGLIFLVFLNLVFGTRIVAGDAKGGGDGRILPPDIWSIGHLNQTFMLLISGSVLMLFQFRHGNLLRIHPKDFLALAIFGSFLFLWNFDLGWRQDLDLIIASSVILLWSPSYQITPHTQKTQKYSQLFIAVLAVNIWLVLGQVEWVFKSLSTGI
jgi:hypothetical protein